MSALPSAAGAADAGATMPGAAAPGEKLVGKQVHLGWACFESADVGLNSVVTCLSSCISLPTGLQGAAASIPQLTHVTAICRQS